MSDCREMYLKLFRATEAAAACLIAKNAAHLRWTAFSGDPAGIRTPDTLLKRQVLCLLSYWGKSECLFHNSKPASS